MNIFTSLKNMLLRRTPLSAGGVQLQIRNANGSWRDVKNEKVSGTYRTITLVNGTHVFSDAYEVEL